MDQTNSGFSTSKTFGKGRTSLQLVLNKKEVIFQDHGDNFFPALGLDDVIAVRDCLNKWIEERLPCPYCQGSGLEPEFWQGQKQRYTCIHCEGRPKIDAV